MDLIKNEPQVIGVPLQQHKRLQLHPLLECSALQISCSLIISLWQQVRDASVRTYDDRISVRVSMDLKDMFTV